MLVGKATAGWGEEKAGSKVSLTEKFIEEGVIAGRYHSQFWSFLTTLALALHKHPTLENDKGIDRSVAWSNVMRIGNGEKNPSGVVAELQRKICLELIKREIELNSPTHLVFATGDSYWREVQKFFPVEWAEHTSDYWQATYSQIKIFSTRHPQGWKKELRDGAIEHIASS